MSPARNRPAAVGNPLPPGQSNDEFDNMMNTVRDTVDHRNVHSFRICIPRNILLVGRTRTGKSTLCKVVENPFYVPEAAGLYSETREICFNHLAGQHLDQFYHLNFIDSPGFYDVTRNVGEKLTNETIRRFINDCIVKDVTEINVFAFVFSIKTGINTEDINSMIFIKTHYPHLQQYFLLLVTHCEEKSTEERDFFVEQFFQHPKVMENELRTFFGLGVHFLGCLRPELRRNPNTNAAVDQIKNVVEMRKTLIDFLADQEETFNIHYLDVEETPRQQSPGKTWVVSILVILALLIFYLYFCEIK